MEQKAPRAYFDKQGLSLNCHESYITNLNECLVLLQKRGLCQKAQVWACVRHFVWERPRTETRRVHRSHNNNRVECSRLLNPPARERERDTASRIDSKTTTPYRHPLNIVLKCIKLDKIKKI